MRLAYSYKRFSTPEQSKGDSLRRQDEKFVQCCQKHNLTPATVYFDEGKSGWKGDRQKEFGKFLELVRSGQIPQQSWLIIESLDRLSRKKFRKVLRIIEEIVECGITIATTNPERIINLENLDDPMVMMEILFIAVRSAEESDRKSERVKAAWGEKLHKAKTDGTIATKRCPAWISYDEDSKGWRKIPERVKVVKQIFKLATTEGLGQRAICKHLNRSGVTPFKTRKGSGNKWGWAYIRNILTDRKVLGEISTKAGVIPNYYPQIISENDFLKVQAQTSKRQKWRGNPGSKIANLFSGIAFDSESGSTMVYFRKHAKTQPRWTPSKYEVGSNERGKSFPYNLFELTFLEVMKQLKLDDVGIINRDFDGEIEQLDSQIDQIDIQIEKMKAKLTAMGTDPEPVIETMAELSARRKGLASELEKAKAEKVGLSPTEALKASQSLVERLYRANKDEVRELRLQLRQQIRNLVQKIEIKLVRKGWEYHLGALIHFHSGKNYSIYIRTRRGKPVLIIADKKRWENDPKESGQIGVQFDKSGNVVKVKATR